MVGARCTPQADQRAHEAIACPSSRREYDVICGRPPCPWLSVNQRSAPQAASLPRGRGAKPQQGLQPNLQLWGCLSDEAAWSVLRCLRPSSPATFRPPLCHVGGAPSHSKTFNRVCSPGVIHVVGDSLSDGERVCRVALRYRGLRLAPLQPPAPDSKPLFCLITLRPPPCRVGGAPDHRKAPNRICSFGAASRMRLRGR